MKCTQRVRAAALVALLLGSPLVGSGGVRAQEPEQQPEPQQQRTPAPVARGMKITACTVISTKDASKTLDCSAEAARLCNGKEQCEIQIGYNLSAGQDIDPSAGVIGKMVTILYACGAVSRQRGPYPQSDHASLILECMGPL